MNEQKIASFVRHLAANRESARQYRARRLKELAALKRDVERADDSNRDYALRQYEASRRNFEDLQRRFKAAKARLDEAARTHRQRSKELLGEKQVALL